LAGKPKAHFDNGECLMNREQCVALQMLLHFALSTAADGAILICKNSPNNDDRHTAAQREACWKFFDELDALTIEVNKHFEDQLGFEQFLTKAYALLLKIENAGIGLVGLGVRRDYPAHFSLCRQCRRFVTVTENVTQSNSPSD
jgi:hypothetical protein